MTERPNYWYIGEPSTIIMIKLIKTLTNLNNVEFKVPTWVFTFCKSINIKMDVNRFFETRVLVIASYFKSYVGGSHMHFVSTHENRPV